jgi:hypothetical protein
VWKEQRRKKRKEKGPAEEKGKLNVNISDKKE